MPITLTALNDEITNDPLNLGYAPLVSAGDDSGIATILNAKNDTQNVPIPISTVILWAARNNVLSAFDAAAKTAGPLQSVAIAVMAMFQGGFTPTLDTQDPDIAAMIDASVQGSLMTADQKTSLLALALAPASRAEVLFGTGTAIDCYTVGHALRG